MITQSPSKVKLPFKEAMDYFGKKQVLPTAGYKDVEREMHDRAFMVAGCAKQEVLIDLQKAVEKAIAEGTTLADFRKEFDKIIQDKWVPNQNSGWRARVIYETNMRTAYAAGRYKQLTEMKETHPYWQYHHGDSRKVREEHLALDGKVLSADDPWWDKNYPPNGWGCSCYVTALTEGQMQRLKDARPKKDIAIDTKKEASTDPHWQYAPGKQEAIWPAASPKGTRPEQVAGGKFVPLNTTLDTQTWEDHNRPEFLEPQPAVGKILEVNTGNPVETLQNLLGGKQKVVNVECADWKLPLVIDAQGLGGHLTSDRIPFLGLLDDAIKPQEIWAQFMKNNNGKVVLRYKMINSVEIQGRKLLLVCEGNDKGVLDAFNFYTMGKASKINKYRVGRLVAHI